MDEHVSKYVGRWDERDQVLLQGTNHKWRLYWPVKVKTQNHRCI